MTPPARLTQPLPTGDTLVGLHYELLPWETEPSPREPLDEVAVAVVLLWDGAPATRITWSLDAEREGLAFGGPGPADPSRKIRTVNALFDETAALIKNGLTDAKGRLR